MKQIQLTKHYYHNQQLIGKTVKDISYMEKNDEDHPYLIITFTDDTYIYVCAKHSDEDYDDILLENDYVIPLKCYTGAPGIVYTNKDGKLIFEYYKHLEEQIRLGLAEPDREREIQKIKEAEEAKEKREYNLYLELKKKYEKS